MYNLNKKQKIILGILATIVTMGICYYVYSKDEETLDISQSEDLEITEEIEETEQEDEEEYSDTIIIVHITGAVNKEGIVELKVNSRVADAVEKAGGLREDANTKKINLAYILEDGMKIYIPSVNDTDETIKENNVEGSEYITSTNTTSIDKNSNTSSKTTKVNINTATQTELEELPGIGPSTALKIIQYRDENGKFKDIEDIKEVSGIGESKYNNIKDSITTK